jgi:cytochrome c
MRPAAPARSREVGRTGLAFSLAVCALAVCALAACGPAGNGGSMAAGGDGAGASSAYTFVPLPADAPARFGFGAQAPDARVAAWDVDVKPDGEGLPPGSGTVADGERVYMTQCVACHGPTGTEGPNDRLVSDAPWDQWPEERAVGNYWPYATTLFDYVSKAMPQLTPGTLSTSETYAVIAYILHLNGVLPEDAVIDAETLPAVRMPARDRFVVDDRSGGGEVR